MKKLLFILLFGTFGLFAQDSPQLHFDHITNEMGLPSNTVTCALEDKQGFMWFGTRRGLTRFDGYEFKDFNTDEIFGVAQSADGTVYVSTDTEKLLALDPVSNKITVIDGKADGGAFHTFIDSYGDVWYSDRNGINRYNPKTKKRAYYPLKKTTYVWNKGRVVEDKNRTIWVLGLEVGLFRFDRKTNKLACVVGLDCPRKNLFDASASSELYQGFAEDTAILWIALGGQGLLRYNTVNNSYKIFSSAEKPFIFSLSKGKDSNNKPIFWIGTDNGIGIFDPKIEKFEFLKGILPTHFSVNHIIQSRNGNVWFCTSEGLLLYSPHKQAIQSYKLPTFNPLAKNNNTNAILQDRTDPSGQTFWLLSAYNGLWKWNRKTNTTTAFSVPTSNSTFEGLWLIQDTKNRIWVGGNQWKDNGVTSTEMQQKNEGIFLFDPQSEKFLPTPFTTHHSFFSVPFYSVGKIDTKNRFWIANHYEGVHVLNLSGKELLLWDKAAHDKMMKDGNWVMDILEDKQGKMWFATYKGLWYFNEQTKAFVDVTKDKTGFNNGKAFLKIAQANDGNIWAVGWHFLAKFSALGNFLKQWSKQDGIYDYECRNIAVDEKNQAWIGTYDGLHRFDESENKFRRTTIEDGLLSNSTMAGFWLKGNELIVGQNGGWNTVDTQKLGEVVPSTNLQFSEILVNGRAVSTTNTAEIVLEREENDVQFSFTALNFEKKHLRNFQYFLENWDDKWQNTNQNTASYSNLPPGNYVFHVKKPLENWGRELIFKFTVKSYWYETLWSKALLLLMLSAVFVYFYVSRRKYKQLFLRLQAKEAENKEKDDEFSKIQIQFQQKISQTEITALRAQMNPHFIFNCLNSIQLFTAQNEAEKASEYLSKFSRLIRLVLENSRSEKVTLENELETLRLYIEMEAMRFKGKVSYHINIAEGIDTSYIQIPPLLVQPFVENAIWHGLMHKDAGGTIGVEVTQPNENLLHIEILDDGIGREKAAEFKSKSATINKSFGMKVTNERIELINQLYNSTTKVQVFDLNNQQGEASGTKVVLEIPI